jgi:hypothetical protein
MKIIEQEIMQVLEEFSRLQTNLVSSAARREITKKIIDIIIRLKENQD